MKNLMTMLIFVISVPLGTALASGPDDNGLADLLEERRKGTILPLFAILRSINDITGDDIVEIEFQRKDGLVKYGIYFLTPEGVRREVYVDAQTGEVLEVKAAE